MKGWILSVVGVIALGVLVDIVLPDGKIAKYVKGAFSLTVVLVIGSIIPIIANADFSLDFDSGKYFSSNTASVETLEKPTYYPDLAQQKLKEQGYSASVEIEWSGTLIEKVLVHVDDDMASGEQIAQIVADCLDISKQRVWVIYGAQRARACVCAYNRFRVRGRACARDISKHKKERICKTTIALSRE